LRGSAAGGLLITLIGAIRDGSTRSGAHDHKA
jgi:hypothetical protein